MPTLSLAANIGLVLFLFLVGLEVDLRIMVSNLKTALCVGAAGMALPFGLGCGIAYGLYHQFRTDSGLVPISFGTYMLFVGVAMAITAFPVLCRILTELKLLQNHVGVIVLSAGVSNDVVGWILLALCVALVNAGSGITALYILLVAIGYILLLVYAVRPGFLWILRRTGSIQNGPTQSVVGLTILMTLASAFFTGIIGIHPIFGAFLMGLICPHDGGFAIKLTEKIEDLVTVLFLPLYFALSGLSTNLGLLNTGTTWGYVIGVISVAFFGKIVGGTIAARLCKLVWRESFTVGVLMSCKGLVELIVLNIGLQAKILSQRTFTIFVVMALVTTFATTPLTSALYPPWYQKKMAAWRRGEINWDGTPLILEDTEDDDTERLESKRHPTQTEKILVYLRLDSLPSLVNFLSLLSGEKAGAVTKKSHPRKGSTTEQTPLLSKPLKAHGLRMFELTDRLSSAMKDSEVEDYSARDPVVSAFRNFGQLNHMAVSGEVQIVSESDYAKTLNGSATTQGSDLVLLPWSETGAIGEAPYSNFLDSASESFSNASQNHFVRQFLANAPCNAAILVDNHFKEHIGERPQPLRRAVTEHSTRSTQHLPTMPFVDRSHHIFFPFIGGADDQFALRFVLQLAQNSNITATIIYVQLPTPTEISNHGISAARPIPSEPTIHKDGVNVIASPVDPASSERDHSFFMSIRDSLSEDLKDRVYFEINTSLQSAGLVDLARSELKQTANNASNICIVGRNHCRNSLDVDGNALPEIRHTLGGLAAGLLGKVEASVLVIQAGRKPLAEQL